MNDPTNYHYLEYTAGLLHRNLALRTGSMNQQQADRNFHQQLPGFPGLKIKFPYIITELMAHLVPKKVN